MATPEQRSIVKARWAVLVFDTLIVAYTMWCVDLLLGDAGFLDRYPYLLFSAPLIAVLWEISGQSLAQTGYGLRMVDESGTPASLDQRAVAGLVYGLFVGALIAVSLAIEPLPVLIGCAIGIVIAMFLPDRRTLAERAAGAYETLERVPPTVVFRPWYRRPASVAVVLLLVLTIGVGLSVTEFEPTELIENAERTVPMWRQLVHPDWSITGRVVARMVETIFIALVASVLAVPIAFCLSFLGARNLMRGSPWARLVYGVTRFFLNLIRSVEPVLWAIIFSLWVGVGPDAGMLALLVHSVAALGKLYSESIESIDPGPVEAITATGASRLQVIRYGIVPQVVPQFLSFTVYRWDINVRMATILGFVGGGGIGEMLHHYTALSAWSKVGVIVVFMTLVVWALDLASAKARERMV